MQGVVAAQHRLHATCASFSGYPDRYHETPERVEVILAALVGAGFPPLHAPEDHGMAPLQAAHDADFVAFLQDGYARSRRDPVDDLPLWPSGYFAVRGWQHRPCTVQQQAGYYALDRDCPLLAGTWAAAYWSAQTALSAAARVWEGDRAVYALCRPPGHHAGHSQYGGYCYLNNAAIAARWLQQRSAQRVAIVDIDYHHGNGTQDIFYSDPAVLTCSLHADPNEEYPYFWGGADETGEGAGRGTNRNWPLPARTDDTAYLAALDEAVQAVRAFQPAFLVISAGFDLLEGDPSATSGGFHVTMDGLTQIGQQLAGLALPTLIVQEGGYQLERLGQAAVCFLTAWGSAG